MLPTKQTMYRALVRKGPTFEGIFFAAVRTTGVFFRPTCPSRRPNRENVEFYASAEDAMAAGYRPCLRCRPREARTPELVEKLRGFPGRLTDAALQKMGLDPSTVRRQFRRAFGMSFHAYQRAARLAQAHRRVRQGAAVIEAQLENGFESPSGFVQAFKRVVGAPPSRARDATLLVGRRIETPLGPMIAQADDRGLHRLDFANGQAMVPGEHPYLDLVERELRAYFEGTSMTFTVPLVAEGSEFQRRVWAMLQRIPPGRTWSYSELAAKVGRPEARRAVGGANNRNPIAIVIPCHRVIGADGTLCGYGGGLWRKRWLLEHERMGGPRTVGRIWGPR